MKGHYSKQGATRNLLIRDVILDRNFRQGMSVISAENMLVINTTFSNTNGTAPMAVRTYIYNKYVCLCVCVASS